MNLLKLRAELDTGNYSADSVIAASELNDKSITVKSELPAADVKRYLIINGVWLPIKRATSDAAETVRDALDAFEVFDLSDTTTLATIDATLSQLVTETLLTSAQKAELMALADISISRAEQVGLGRVRAGDVERARSI